MGGVAITLSQIRTTYWIPLLRKIKTIMKNCFKCKRYRAMAYTTAKPGPLTKFELQSVIQFKLWEKLKSYIVLFSYNMSIMVTLELVPDLTTQVFIESLKKLKARHRSPKTKCSENAKSRLRQEP